MDRATWQQEMTNALAEHQQAHEALESATHMTQSRFPVQLESIDTAQVERLTGERDAAWRRIIDLLKNRPA